ncbi:histidinol-phosphate transaminase [Bosea sp. 2YAB26]|uniref:pyridoxal phosphate-dependent aminotransferase n=1 Tax=Bosea sp. 2YAB26 TaxID=3237478 RepID=UPI003F8D910C
MSNPTVIPVPRIARLQNVPARRTPAPMEGAPPPVSLHLNESSEPPAPSVVAAMCAAAGQVNRYPDHDGASLIEALASRLAVPPAQIVLGAGSNELLFASAELALDADDEAVAPHPGFPAYAKGAAMRGAKLVSVPNRRDGLVDVVGTLGAITDRTRLVFVASPHNPTGGMLDEADVEQLVAGVPDHALLHFDEAYFEFGHHAGGPDVLAILRRRSGPWISTRTFSKAFGLAGIRVGYGIVGSPALADAYRKIRTNFSVNAVALAGAEAALKEPAYLTDLLSRTADGRDWLADQLKDLGFVALPSAANFLAVLTPAPAAEFFSALKAANIHIMMFDVPGTQGALRISIGARDEMAALVAVLKRAVG